MILVVANYRTGSTTACQELAGRYSYINEDEVFSFDRDPNSQQEFERLIVNKKSDVVIKIMPDHMLACEKIIPGFKDKLIDAADQIYYTIRLDFEAQCKSWYVCCETQKWHIGDESNITMDLAVDTENFHGRANWLLDGWKLIDQMYKQKPGECIVLESRNPCGLNAPYTFNKQAINNATWPEIDKDLLAQFNDLAIIKEAK